MATPQQYALLDEREENDLHKSRLLNVEERPFKRITKRLAALTSPNAQKLPTPPPDATDTQDAAAASSLTRAATDADALKEDILFDFAAFDSAIARLQFLATANAAERERYAADRLRILQTMDEVRNNNTQLRIQLEGARATLAQRKKFDELADKITSNRMLRTRAEQHVNITKLTEECDELQRESGTYAETWRVRKDQFDRLVNEGVNLQKLIRDEKEEVERREGMDEDGEEDESTPANRIQSGNGTPRPASSSGRTPLPGSPGATVRDNGSGLKPLPDQGGSFSRGGSQAPSFRAGTPRGGSPRGGSPKRGSPNRSRAESRQRGRSQPRSRAGSQAPSHEERSGRGRSGQREDVEMADSTQAVDTTMAEGNTAQGSAENGDKMDTT